jgi:hypothetical protein
MFNILAVCISEPIDRKCQFYTIQAQMWPGLMEYHKSTHHLLKSLKKSLIVHYLSPVLLIRTKNKIFNMDQDMSLVTLFLIIFS